METSGNRGRPDAHCARPERLAGGAAVDPERGRGRRHRAGPDRRSGTRERRRGAAHRLRVCGGAPRRPARSGARRFEILDEQRRPLSFEELPGRQALQGRSAERTLCYRLRATGEERWSILRAEPVYDEDVVREARDQHDPRPHRPRPRRRARSSARRHERASASLDFEETPRGSRTSSCRRSRTTCSSTWPETTATCGPC